MASEMLGFLALAGACVCHVPPPSITVVRKENLVEFRANDELIARYHAEKNLSKPFFFPLNAPGEIPLTRNWPGGSLDHPHQKSAWFCHGDVVPAGIELTSRVRGVKGVDFWSELPGHGNIICTSLGEPSTDANKARIVTKNIWKSADGVAIMDETRIIEVAILDGGSRLIVVQSELRPNGMHITFADTKEGAFGVRVSDKLRVGDGKSILNSQSRITLSNGLLGESKSWGQRSDWCDYSGIVNGKPVGIAMFDDPGNKPRACWHVRDYGLLAANPFGRWTHAKFPGVKDIVEPATELRPGETLRLRYGLLLHDGDSQSGNVAAGFRSFLALVD